MHPIFIVLITTLPTYYALLFYSLDDGGDVLHAAIARVPPLPGQGRRGPKGSSVVAGLHLQHREGNKRGKTKSAITVKHVRLTSLSGIFTNRVSLPELIGSLKLDNVWVFLQLIHRPTRTQNQLYKNQNIA